MVRFIEQVPRLSQNPLAKGRTLEGCVLEDMMSVALFVNEYVPYWTRGDVWVTLSSTGGVQCHTVVVGGG